MVKPSKYHFQLVDKSSQVCWKVFIIATMGQELALFYQIKVKNILGWSFRKPWYHHPSFRVFHSLFTSFYHYWSFSWKSLEKYNLNIQSTNDKEKKILCDVQTVSCMVVYFSTKFHAFLLKYVKFHFVKVFVDWCGKKFMHGNGMKR